MPRRFKDTQFVRVDLRTRYTAFEFVGQVLSFENKDNYIVKFLMPLSSITKCSYWANSHFPSCDYKVSCKTHELHELSLSAITKAVKVTKRLFDQKIKSVNDNLLPQEATLDELENFPEHTEVPSNESRGSYNNHLYGYGRTTASRIRIGKFMVKSYWNYTNENSKFFQSLAYMSFALTRINNVIDELVEYFVAPVGKKDNFITSNLSRLHNFPRVVDNNFIKTANVPSLALNFFIEPKLITRSDYV
tara:strand:- start:266 stop:1006 length:741 start_codon:yes stop_codon:yes gene_type:complete